MADSFDVTWDDPLPHTLSPTKSYLSRLTPGRTKAAVIFLHGRDDDIDDMVAVFLPILQRRYGGLDTKLDDDEEEADGECKVAVVGIEARDNSWYPESHNATLDYQVANNRPYRYSALDKIRRTILHTCESAHIQPKNVILVGFSQGANLSNTYLQAGLTAIKESKDAPTLVTLPGCILALAGSLFKAAPTFPSRQYASLEHKEQSAKEEKDYADRLSTLVPPTRVIDRLLCGTGDRFFSQDEIKEAASTLVQASSGLEGMLDVQISVGLEPNAPHMITNRMMAATVEAIDAMLA